MKTRKAETLIEVVTAMTLFGIIMSGLFDFMANQTLNLAYLKDRQTIMYYAQKWIASNDVSITSADNGYVKFSSADNVLTVTLDNNTSMAFSRE